jgi:DNA replication protein DnaC
MCRRGVDYPHYLLRLAELELIDRERRMVERRIREARFPTVKSLDSFRAARDAAFRGWRDVAEIVPGA